jgi:hypothetical protein
VLVWCGVVDGCLFVCLGGGVGGWGGKGAIVGGRKGFWDEALFPPLFQVGLRGGGGLASFFFAMSLLFSPPSVCLVIGPRSSPPKPPALGN